MKSTKYQKRIAAKLGIQLDTTSFNIAAAQILDEIEAAISKHTHDQAVSEKQIIFASELAIDVSDNSRRVASVRIGQALDKINRRLIKQWRLMPGVSVKWKRWDRIMVISSIAENGRLWFKGGNGLGAFPLEIEPIRDSKTR
jgi:hypothetical protein